MSKKSINIIIDSIVHLAISLEVFLIAYAKTGDFFYFFIAILGGVVIDVDHGIDCLIQFKKVNLKKILIFPYLKKKYVYLFLHSWELVAIFAFFSFFFNSLPWQVFVFSWALHLLVDNLDDFKRKGFFHYFLFYRFKKGFKTDKLEGFIFIR